MHDDRELIERLVRNRDSAAFEALYNRHTAALFESAVRLLGPDEAAADVVHDTWLVAVERLPSFEHRSSLRTWLTGILVNVVRVRWRDEREVVPLELVSEELLAPAALPTEIDPIDLDAAIRALPPRFRAVLILHDIEGFTHDEIATILGVVPGTSKSQLARARARLRELLTTDSQRRAL